MAVRKRAGTRHRGHIPLAVLERERQLADRARARARVMRTRAIVADVTRTTVRRRAFAAAPPSDLDFFDPRKNGVRLSGPVRDQPLGDDRCTAFAITGAMETWLCRTNDSTQQPSISAAHAFKLADKQKLVSVVAKAVAKGVLEEACFGASPPCPDAPQRTWRGTVRRVDEGDDDRPAAMRQLLLSGKVLVTAIPLFPNFESFLNKAETDVYEPDGTAIGAHALVIVGYARTSNPGGGVWIVKNSFGPSWGNGGYGRLEWTDSFLQVERVIYAVEEVRK